MSTNQTVSYFLSFESGSFLSAKHSRLYAEPVAALWAKNCVLSPWCVFTPNTTKDVAEGLAIIRRTNTRFSVRGAGHMPVNNLDPDNFPLYSNH